MIKEAIEKAAKRIDLSQDEMDAAFDEIMSGRAAPADIESFLRALRDKGETVDEITAAAKVMRAKSARIKVKAGTLVDTCGTGGTGINTFNISTAAAFIAAGCGVRIAKHGNRSSSGHCGSADLLEALGVKIDISPEKCVRCIDEIGIGFLFAPAFHAAMKYAAGPRKAIGGRTIFNILGPLSNPAGATHQVIGVYDGRLTEKMAGVLKKLGSERALVVHGGDSLDEVTTTTTTRITQLDKGALRTYEVTPEDFGVKASRLEDIKGYGAKENAEIFLSVLTGKPSACRDITLVNASANLVCAGAARDFRDGMRLAGRSVDSGEAMKKLTQLIEMTNI